MSKKTSKVKVFSIIPSQKYDVQKDHRNIDLIKENSRLS